MTGERFRLFLLDQALSRQATVLVPNNRLREAILMELGQREQNVFRTPQVFAVDLWITELWSQLASRGIAPCCDKQILAGHEELFIWTGLVEGSISQLPLINPEETAASLSRAYQFMQQWQLDVPDLSVMQQFDGIPDVAAFLQWIEQFRESCQQLGVLPLVTAIGEMAELVARQPQCLPGTSFALVNFFQPPPLYKKLFAALPQAEQIFTANSEATVVPANSARQALADPHSEIRACAEWAAGKLRAEPAAHVGVICNARESRHAEFTRAIADALKPESLFDFSSGEALFNSAGSAQSLMSSGLIHDAFLILGLSQSQQSSDDLCRLLQSPYFLPGADDKQARLHMELFMRQRFTKRCHLQEFLACLSQPDRDYHCPDLASALVSFNTILRSAAKRQAASGWQQTFTSLLETLQWPGSEATAFEQRLLEQWQRVLDSFARANNALGPIDCQVAINRLRMLCQRTPQWQESGLHRSLSFYSVNEALGLQFDHLWLLGFDDQSWPQPTAPTPFLPHPLQQQHGLPAATSNQQYELARRQTAILLQSVSGELVASYYQREGDQEFRLSSFILALAETHATPTSNAAINAFALQQRGSSELQQLSDPDSLPVTAAEEIRGGHAVLSHQSSCPFRAFAAHRLKVEPLDDFGTGLSAMARGSAIHIALEQLFAPIEDLNAVLALSATQRTALCVTAADRAIEYLTRRHQYLMTPRFRGIEHARIQRLLLAFLQLESERRDFSVVAREEELQFQREQLTLTLKIDRIDRLADGTLAVLDYKTGKSAAQPKSWLEERPEDVQLPVYSVAAAQLQEGQVSAVTLAHLHTEKSGYSGLFAAANFHPRNKTVTEDRQLQTPWAELQARFNTLVATLAGDFMRGHTLVDPAHGPVSCQYCGLQALCRVQHGQDSDDESASIEAEQESAS